MARPNNTIFAAWLRGGQTFGHTLAMVTGVLHFITKWLLIPAIVCYVWLTTWATELETQYGFLVLQARLFEWFGAPAPDILAVPVAGVGRENYHVSDIPHLPFVEPLASAYFEKTKHVFFVWCCFAIILVGLQAYFFTTSGKAKLKTRQVKGQQVVSAPVLQQEIRAFNETVEKAQRLPPIKRPTLVGIDYPHDGEFEHTMITGGVGSGKSVALKGLLKSIRDRNDRAIIYDPEGEFIRDFYDPTIDVILNPFDDRSPAWSTFFDAVELVDWDRLAHGLFPDPKSGDPYWASASRSLFAWSGYSLQKRWPGATLKDQLNLFFGPTDNLVALLKDTPAAKHLDGAPNPRTTSLLSMLTEGVTPLVHLMTNKEPFSIRQWINHKERRPGFLFLSAPESHIATLRPLLGFWADIAVSALLSRMTQGIPPIPTWIVLDEFTSLGRVDSLAEGPARLRKHGGAMVFGLQQVSQLKDIYGADRALTIIGQCTNKLILRANDHDTAKTMSLMLGERVMHRVTEATTYGANTIRDGVGLTPKEEKEPVFSPTAILNFPALQGAIRVSNRRPSMPFPVATVKFTPVQLQPVAAPFVPLNGRNVVDDFLNRHAHRSTAAQTPPGAAAAALHAKALNASSSTAAPADATGSPPGGGNGGGKAQTLALVVDNTGSKSPSGPSPDQTRQPSAEEKAVARPQTPDLFSHKDEKSLDQALAERAGMDQEPSTASDPDRDQPSGRTEGVQRFSIEDLGLDV